MIWVVGVLTGVIAFLVLLFVAQGVVHREEMKTSHAKCMGMTAAFVGDKFAAAILDSCAERYDSMDGLGAQSRIRNTTWAEDGPSVPALWMREQADLMREKEKSYVAAED